MEDELIDIVNENNEVIGKSSRSVAHAKGLIHRSVQVLLFDSKGRLLLQRRSSRKEVCPLFWDLSAAEHLRTGESYPQAANRSLMEELGITTRIEKMREEHLQKFEYENGKIRDYEFVELYKASYDGEIKINRNEIAAGAFFRIPDIRKMIKQNRNQFTPWFLDEWKYIEEHWTL